MHHLTQRASIAIAAIGQKQTPLERLRLRQKSLRIGRVRRPDHGGRRITEHIHGGMEFHSRRLDGFEAPRKHLPSGIMERQGGAILDDDLAKLCNGSACGEAKHLEGHLAHEAFGLEAQAIGTVRCGQLLIERFVADAGTP